MKHNIYIGGYVTNGNSAGPSYLGEAEGETFKEACANFCSTGEHKRYYDPKTNTYWGCRLGPTMYSVCDDYPPE